MNKLFTRIATLSVGLTLAIGMGVAAGSNNEAVPVHATSGTELSIGSYASSNNWANGTAYPSITYDSNISISGKSGGNNNKYYSSNNSWRQYEGDSAVITITASGGATLSSATFTYAVGNSGVLKYGGTNTSSGTAISLSGTSASFSVGHSSGTKSGNIQITSISVTYTAASSKILSNISVSTAPTKTSYLAGEYFDPTGLVITRTYSDLTSDTYSYANHTSEFTFSPTTTTALTTSDTSVSITYGGKSTTQAITVSAAAPGGDYEKITSEQADWSGEYLLVYENSSTAYVWTGVDAASCYATATITNNAISKPVGAVSLIIDTMEGGYSIQVSGGTNNGKYICGTSGSNALKFSASKSLNTISYDSGVDIVSDTSHLRFNSASDNMRFRYFKSATYSTQKAVQLYKLAEEEKTIVSSRMVSGTVSAKTGDTSWTVSGFKFFVTYEGDSDETEVTSQTTFAVAESVPAITESGSTQVTVTPTFKGVTYTEKAAQVNATLTYVDSYSIEHLYGIELALGGSQEGLTCDGILMDYITRTTSNGTFYDLYLGSGNYGMLVYGTETDPSSYTLGETYLTATGTLKNYNYLYEMADATVSVLTDTTRKANVTAPSTYVVDGTESASTLYLASRKTSLSGTIYSINDNATPGTKATSNANNSIYVTVGGNNVLLYIKTAQATAEVAAKFVVGDPITVEGFTTYYNKNNTATFEVLYKNVVDPEEDYHAADFARELLKNTKSYCNSSYDGSSNQKEVLTGVWTALATDGWLKVQAAGEANTLVNGTADSTIVVPEGESASETDALIDAMSDADAIAAALYRYDYCTAKYSLSNFMTRSLSVSFSNNFILNTSNNTMLIVVVASIATVSSIGLCILMIKKRKHQ